MIDALEAQRHLTFVCFLEHLDASAKIKGPVETSYSCLSSYASGMKTGTVTSTNTFLELSTTSGNSVVGTNLRDVGRINSIANSDPFSPVGHQRRMVNSCPEHLSLISWSFSETSSVMSRLFFRTPLSSLHLGLRQSKLSDGAYRDKQASLLNMLKPKLS